MGKSASPRLRKSGVFIEQDAWMRATLIIAHADERYFQLQPRCLLCAANARGRHTTFGVPFHGDIDLIHSEHAGTGGKPLGREVGREPLAVLFPMSRVGERCIATRQLAVWAKLHNASAFTNRRSKPDRIFALSDHECAMAFIFGGQIGQPPGLLPSGSTESSHFAVS